MLRRILPFTLLGLLGNTGYLSLDAHQAPMASKEFEHRCPGKVDDGKVVRSHRNGQRATKGTCTSGKPTGKWTTWHADGQKRFLTTFVDGVLDGSFRSWHANGQKAAQLAFVMGGRHGDFSAWSERGERIVWGQYQDGRRSGCWVERYPNGETDPFVVGCDTDASPPPVGA